MRGGRKLSTRAPGGCPCAGRDRSRARPAGSRRRAERACWGSWVPPGFPDSELPDVAICFLVDCHFAGNSLVSVGGAGQVLSAGWVSSLEAPIHNEPQVSHLCRARLGGPPTRQAAARLNAAPRLIFDSEKPQVLHLIVLTSSQIGCGTTLRVLRASVDGDCQINCVNELCNKYDIRRHIHETDT